MPNRQYDRRGVRADAGKGGMKLRGLKRYRRGSIEYVYHRASGIRLPSGMAEDHPDFLSAYLAACEAPGKRERPIVETVKANSVEDVVKRYLASHAFAGLSDSYQAVRRRDTTRLLKSNGGAVAKVPFAAVRAEHIRHHMDTLSRNPANERLKTWSALSEFALERRIVSVKPTEGVKQLKAQTVEGYIPWVFAEN